MPQAAENTLSFEKLKPQCKECFGLCCTALYFSKHEGFPADKKAGMPCPNIKEDFRCNIHEKLGKLGYKGCIAYECFGAGQQVSQITFSGQSWRNNSSAAGLMFDVFIIMRQLNEICWYLTEALMFKPVLNISDEIETALNKTQQITCLTAHEILTFDLKEYHFKISCLLKQASEMMRSKISSDIDIKPDNMKNTTAHKNYCGKDLRNKDLRCADLRGACLIAANLRGADLTGADFIGADMRDANLKGADLTKSIFLTQPQINAAKGNGGTKLPPELCRPESWNNN